MKLLFGLLILCVSSSAFATGESEIDCGPISCSISHISDIIYGKTKTDKRMLKKGMIYKMTCSKGWWRKLTKHGVYSRRSGFFRHGRYKVYSRGTRLRCVIAKKKKPRRRRR